jgi:hypothetical protein
LKCASNESCASRRLDKEKPTDVVSKPNTDRAVEDRGIGGIDV